MRAGRTVATRVPHLIAWNAVVPGAGTKPQVGRGTELHKVSRAGQRERGPTAILTFVAVAGRHHRWIEQSNDRAFLLLPMSGEHAPEEEDAHFAATEV